MNRAAGNFYSEAPGKEIPEHLHRHIRRMKHISGFVTTLVRAGDGRASVFNRLEHVQRVSWVARQLAESPQQHLDASRMVWMHDLNRWPFAHNSEKGRYNQGEDIGRFLANLIDISPDEVQQLESFHRKDISSLHNGGKLALVSDMLCGVVEDPLLVCVGTNVHPSYIPDSYSDALGGLYRDSDWVETMRECCFALHRDFNTGRFRELFATLFTEAFWSFIDTSIGSMEVGNQPKDVFERAYSISTALKEEFLRPVIFPINNELVCHASWIGETIVDPWRERLGTEEFCSLMLSLDEPALVDRLLNLTEFREIDISRVYPNLDYIVDSRESWAFVKAVDLRRQ